MRFAERLLVLGVSAGWATVVGAEVLDSEASPPAVRFAPDRPATADSAEAVPVGSVMVEAWTEASVGPAATLATVPGAIVRVGVLDGLELRLAAPSVQHLAPDVGDSRTGLADPAAGFKVELPTLGVFTWGLVGMATLPWGSSDFSDGAAQGTGSISFFAPLAGPLALGGSAMAGSTGPSGDRQLATGGSLQGWLTLSETFTAYGDMFAQHVRGGELSPGIGGGLAAALMPTLQVDVGFDTGLGEHGPDPRVQLGVSVQF